MTTDPRPAMRETIKQAANNLLAIRRMANPDLSYRAMLQDCWATFRENARDSYGTSMEPYWRLMADLTAEMMQRGEDAA